MNNDKIFHRCYPENTNVNFVLFFNDSRKCEICFKLYLFISLKTSLGKHVSFFFNKIYTLLSQPQFKVAVSIRMLLIDIYLSDTK